MKPKRAGALEVATRLCALALGLLGLGCLPSLPSVASDLPVAKLPVAVRRVVVDTLPDASAELFRRGEGVGVAPRFVAASGSVVVPLLRWDNATRAARPKLSIVDRGAAVDIDQNLTGPVVFPGFRAVTGGKYLSAKFNLCKGETPKPGSWGGAELARMSASSVPVVLAEGSLASDSCVARPDRVLVGNAQAILAGLVYGYRESFQPEPLNTTETLVLLFPTASVATPRRDQLGTEQVGPLSRVSLAMVRGEQRSLEVRITRGAFMTLRHALVSLKAPWTNEKVPAPAGEFVVRLDAEWTGAEPSVSAWLLETQRRQPDEG